MTPRVSVGMPVFNGAAYLRESIESVLDQTFADFELLISDNASTDDTESICREYANRDSRIRYMRQPKNIGALANFELLLNEARGPYFMWVAADDLPAANWIEHLVRNLREGDLGVFGEYQYVSESGKPTSVPATPRNLTRGSQLSTFMLPDTSGKCFYIYSLFRREPLTALRVFDEKAFLGNDQVIILRLIESGDLRSVPGAVMRYRVHAANTSSREGTERGAYRRTFFSVFPFTYYRHAINALPRGKRLIALPLIPLKYLYEQTRSYSNFARLVVRLAEERIRQRIHVRGEASHG